MAGWVEWLALVLAPLSFTVLLRAAPRDAGLIVLTGFLAALSGRLGGNLLGPELGMFLGALVVGTVSNAFGFFLRRLPEVTLVPGILLLVPGSIGFRSLAQLLDKDVVLGVETAFRMVFVAISLVAGMLVANAVVPRRKRG